jgi:hypothetical protein
VLVIIKAFIKESSNYVTSVILWIKSSYKSKDNFKCSRACNYCVSFALELRVLVVTTDNKACLKVDKLTSFIKFVLIYLLYR